MSESRLMAAVAMFAALWSSGCASNVQQTGDLAPILPASQSRLETAPPAARDALEEGLRWIAEDAPETTIEKNLAIHLAKGAGP